MTENKLLKLFAAFGVLWAVIGGFFSQMLKDLLFEHRFYLLSLVLWLGTGIVAFVISSKLFRFFRKAPTRKEHQPVPVRKGNLHIMALVASLVCLSLGITALVFAWSSFPPLKASFNTKTVELSATKSNLVVGETTSFSIDVDGEEGPPPGYVFKWTVEPQMGSAFDKSTKTFDPTSDLADGTKVKFTVTLYNGLGFSVGTDTEEVVVDHKPSFTLIIDQARLLPGETATIEVLLDGTPVPKGYQYVWSRDDVKGIFRNDKSRFEFSPSSIGETTVSVVVKDKDDRVLNNLSQKVVTTGSNTATAIVLDASERMASSSEQNEQSHLAIAKKNLAERIENARMLGSSVGLFVFGDNESSNSSQPCQTIRTVSDISRNYDELLLELSSVNIGGKDAPLTRAIREGAKALARNQNRQPDRLFELLILTGGLDTCNQKTEQLTSMIARIRRDLNASVTVELALTEFLVAIALEDEEKAAWRDYIMELQGVENGPIVFVAENTGELNSILGSITNLQATTLELRKQACSELTRIAEKMKDKRSIYLIKQYCDTISKR